MTEEDWDWEKVKEGWTFNDRNVAPNLEKAPSQRDGLVYQYLTFNGIPVIYPDLDEGQADPGYEKLPEDIEGVTLLETFSMEKDY